MAIMGWFVFGGFGVAIFRIMCLRDQTMTNMMRTSIVQKIQKLQILLLIIRYFPLLFMMTSYEKWEVMAMYRVCIDENLVQADIRSAYQNKGPLSSRDGSRRVFAKTRRDEKLWLIEIKISRFSRKKFANQDAPRDPSRRERCTSRQNRDFLLSKFSRRDGTRRDSRLVLPRNQSRQSSFLLV